MAYSQLILLATLSAFIFISTVTGYEQRHLVRHTRSRKPYLFLTRSGSCAQIGFDNSECGGLNRGNNSGCESYCGKLGYSESYCRPLYCLCHYEYNSGEECDSIPVRPPNEPENPTEGTGYPHKLRNITDPILIALTQKVIDAPIKWKQP